MRKLLLIVFVLQSIVAFAQPYGNEWVNATQPYLKLKISKEGVYRISYQVLNDALANQGISLSSIDPRNFQVFARGEEQHIYLGGEEDGVFDQNDFIEFYATPNDGRFDDELYLDNPLNNANPYYSMFNDTIWYFVTYNNSITNARITLETDINFNGYAASPYIWRDEIDELHNKYFAGKSYPQTDGTSSPLYTGGEGYYGYLFNGGWTDTFWNLNTEYRYTNGPDPEIEICLVGESNNNKVVHVVGASLAVDVPIEGYDVVRSNYTVPPSALGASTTNFTFSIPSSTSQYQALVSYVKIRYPLTPNTGNVKTAKFLVDDNPNYPTQSKSYIALAGYAQGTPRVYDLTNHKRISVTGTPGSYKFLVPDNGSLKECYITSENIIAANSISNLAPAGPNGSVYFTDFNALDASTDYFAIGHPSMSAEVQQYASYRNSSGYNAIAIDVNELYAQFGWGIEKHPLAIRKFANWALGNLTLPKGIFLIGKSVASMDARTNASVFSEIMVPTMGYPPSDNLFTAFLGAGTFYEETGIPVGRLAAKTPGQVQDYLQKIQEYEALDNELWMKKVLHFSGGGVENEVIQIRSYMDAYKAIIEDTLYGGSVQTFQKTSSEPFQITQVDSVSKLINEGVQMINFFGHGSAVGFDVSIDHPSTFSNDNGKYPMMIANSCKAGDIHQQQSVPTSISENWVLEPQGGA
ncbi:C25 family cysteine peptidase, partial [Bacteroidota bacterium]